MNLIDADELKHKVGELPLVWEYGKAVSDIYAMIEESPTVDAVPVVHGYWILDRYLWNCSVCGNSPSRNSDGSGTGYVQKEEQLWNYCPHCGAKMDEVVAENATSDGGDSDGQIRNSDIPEEP